MPTRSARRLYALMGVKISRAEVPGKEAGSAEPSSASAKRDVYLQARKKMPGMAGHFVQSVTTNGRHPPTAVTTHGITGAAAPPAGR